MFELGKGLFYGIEVWAVGRQEQQVCASCMDCFAHSRALVAAEVIHHHHVAGAECRDEDALDIGAKDVAVDRAVEDPGRVDPIMSERRDKGRGVPVQNGAAPGRRSPFGAQPLSGAMLVLAQVSSMNTRRRGSIQP